MSVEVNADDIETVRLAKAEEAKWKAVREAAEAKIKEQLGEAESGTVDGHEVVTWVTSISVRLDVKELRASVPDAILKPYLKTSAPIRRFILKD